MSSPCPRLHPPPLAAAAALLAALLGGDAQAEPGAGLRWPGRPATLQSAADAAPPRWSIHLGLAPAEATDPGVMRWRGLGLRADHDLDGEAGGLRLSGGLLLGDAAAAWRSLGGLGPIGSGLGHETAGLRPPGRETLPQAGAGYLGIGYSLAPRPSGWGFQADLGLLAPWPRAPVRLGDAPSRSPSPAELIRELRLNPVLQLGVSYAF